MSGRRPFVLPILTALITVLSATSARGTLFGTTGNRQQVERNQAYTIETPVLLKHSARPPIGDTLVNAWGAAWNGVDTVYFSSPTGPFGTEIDATYLWEYSISADAINGCVAASCYTLLGEVLAPSKLEGLRMDGLAYLNGELYAWNQGAKGRGLFTIDPFGLTSSFVGVTFGLDIKGIDATDGVLFGLDDSMRSIVTISPGNGSVEFLEPYPQGVTDVDGLAAGDGKLYLVGDGVEEPIQVFDLENMTYLPTIPGEFVVEDEFSGAAYFEILPPDCDLNGDLLCDIDDLDDLYDKIYAGTYSPAFDLNADGVVDDQDIAPWLFSAGIENGKTYLAGDVTLDGSVLGGDFTLLAASFGSTGTTYWGDGDFDASATVAGSDFTALAANFGFTSIQAVPEPATTGLFPWTIVLLGAIRVTRSEQYGTVAQGIIPQANI